MQFNPVDLINQKASKYLEAFFLFIVLKNSDLII